MQETTAVVIISIARSLSCITCVGVSGWLAYKGLEGWGWFLFVAAMLGSFSINFDK